MTRKEQLGALNGILVLEHTTALSGPYCAQLLGDLGAEVIKIERPGSGDQSRGWGPPFAGGESAYFMGTNRNKRGITLDLTSKKGKEILHKLIRKADVLINNVPKESSRIKLGLDEKTCMDLNERLVWASISGFGNTGPYAEKPGYDVIAQAMSGTMSVTGEEEHGAIRFPTPIADLTTGIYTAFAIVAALFSREKTGKGQCIDNALLDSQVTWLSNLASNHLMTGDTIKKFGNAHPNIVPYQPFPTKDNWIIVAVGSENLWKKFTTVLELSELEKDERFDSNAKRLSNKIELIKILSEKLKTETSEVWLRKLEASRIPSGPIFSPEKILSNEHLLARGMVVELEHPAAGLVKSLGNPMKLSKTPITYRRPAPMLGEHNREVLRELEYSQQEIEDILGEK